MKYTYKQFSQFIKWKKITTFYPIYKLDKYNIYNIFFYNYNPDYLMSMTSKISFKALFKHLYLWFLQPDI